jgi:hypothetical protein
MERAQEHSTIIELDDPTPRGMRIMTALVIVLVALLIIAPFVIDDGASSNDLPSGPQPAVQATQPEVCRPSVDVPSVLDPVAGFALPSWMRLCDWFIGPVITDPGAPSN